MHKDCLRVIKILEKDDCLIKIIFFYHQSYSVNFILLTMFLRYLSYKCILLFYVYNLNIYILSSSCYFNNPELTLSEFWASINNLSLYD